MLRDAFQEIMNKYPQVRNEDFIGNPFASFIRHELPELFQSYFSQFENLIWIASPGKGRWADAPWIAILNPLVTETAQRGYYPVYLFTSSLNSVYLSLNQGMTEIRREFPTDEAKGILRHRAQVLRRRLTPEYKNVFTEDEIHLEHRGPNTRLAFYEPGHTFGIRYDKESLPSTEKIIEDLSSMLNLYNLAIARGGTIEFDNITPTDSDSTTLIDLTLEEQRRYRYHRIIERNQRLSNEAKRVHGYICEVCGFNFEQIYGPLGKNYIEAHHKIPLHRLSTSDRFRLSAKDDFAVVCSNCHSMLHRPGTPATFDEFLKNYHARH